LALSSLLFNQEAQLTMWTINNQQLDPMTLIDTNNLQYNLPGQGNVNVNAAIQTIIYHRLRYQLAPDGAIWPFLNDQNLNAAYDGGSNVRIINPQTEVTAIYAYTAP